MANGVFHTGYGIEINLTLSDLGHPDRPGLLDEILQPIGARPRNLLECLEHRRGGRCQSEIADKSPWMFIKHRRAGLRSQLVAAHLPMTYHPSASESARHLALKERIADHAVANGLQALIEHRSSDRLFIPDVHVIGPAGSVGWEVQLYPLSPSSVRRRSHNAYAHATTPLWVTCDPSATVIDRAPWARVDDMPWQDISNGRDMLIRGGVRHLQLWQCTRSHDRPCPDTRSGCSKWHADWVLPELHIPRRPTSRIDELVIDTANGDAVPLYITSPRNRRGGRYMWVTAQDRQTWIDATGEDTLPTEPADEAAAREDEGIDFTEEDIDPNCRYGEESTGSRKQKRRDAEHRGVTTARTLDGPTLRHPDTPSLCLTPIEREHAAHLLGCKTWDIGPCDRCWRPINRYGRNTGIVCNDCRTALNAALHA